MSFHRFRRQRAGLDARQGSAQPHDRAALAPSTLSNRKAAQLPPTPEVVAAISASPFTALGLEAPLVRATIEESYTVHSPVQT
ncbi:MAG: hypothetical protein ACRELY_10280, partial [Polyangiaceae bacterium]